MRVHAHRSLSVLACTLVVLFFALSFNAYACLLPVNGVTAAPMDAGCSTPDEQPVSQYYCDAFKTLSVQSADKLQLNSDFQTICSQDTATLALRIIQSSSGSRVSDHPTVRLPQDLLLKISVLRI
jgi:membrane-bound inhibitor of C-type lysozyme